MATRRKTRRKNLLGQVPLVTNPFDAAKRKKSALLHVGKSITSNNKKANQSPKRREQENSNSNSKPNNMSSMPSTPTFSIFKPPIARNSTLRSILPVIFDEHTQQENNHSSTMIGVESHNGSNHTQHELLHMDDANSQSWLKSKSIEPESQSHSQSHHTLHRQNPISNNNNSNTTSTQGEYLTPMEYDRSQLCLSQIDVLSNRIFNHTKSKINHHNTDRNGRNLSDMEQLCDDHVNDDTKAECIASKDLRVPLRNEYLDEKERIDLTLYKKQQKKGIVANNRYHRYYEEIELLGNGSFGKVYKCRNRDDGCFYAIKKIKIRSIHHCESVKQRCMQEGVVLSALQRSGTQCANIILYNTMWIEHDYFYLVTEYCDNGNLYNLYNLFDCDEINEQLFMKILSDVCSALSFLHDQGFVHFDVKPENILLSKNADCKLADFGLCTKVMHTVHTDDERRGEEQEINSNNNIALSVQEGDARYLCRELIEGTYVATELDKIDIFAMGCTMFEIIICNDLPANGFNWQQIRNGDLNWTPTQNSLAHKISINFKQLIRTMMHNEPSERPTARRLTLFLHKITDKSLQEKDNQIEQLKNQLKMRGSCNTTLIS